MKKIQYLGLILFAACILVGITTTPQTVIYKSNSTIKKYYPPATTESGIYADNWGPYISNPSWWQTTIVANKVNFVTYYMSSLLDDSGNRTLMRAHLTNMVNAGIKRNFCNVTKSVNAITVSDSGTAAGYNNSCSTSAQKFTGLSQEWEFWKDNPYGDFATFKTNDLAIYNYCKAQGLEYNIYVARCKDVAGVSSADQVAYWLVTHHDNIYLVDYVSTAKYNTYKGLSDGIKTQLILIANAAKAAGKVQKIQILWASTGNAGDNMYSWFIAHPNLLDAYSGFKNAYNNWPFTNKTSLNITGQKIYNFSGLYD